MTVFLTNNGNRFRGGGFRAAKTPSPSAASGDGSRGQDVSFTTSVPLAVARAELSQRDNFHQR